MGGIAALPHAGSIKLTVMNILIDLSILRHPYCGLGQIALNYGRWYAAHAAELGPDIRITLLVPKSHVGAFGPGVDYREARDCYRLAPWLLPHYDLWHSIHQLSPFRPRHGGLRLLTIHDLNFLYEKQGGKRLRYLRRLQRECDSARTVCFISQFARQEALRHLRLSGKELHTIYNGVEDTTLGTQRRPAAVDPSKPFLLCIGVVKAKKNVHTLLPMMDRLPQHTLVIAGNDSDPYAQALRGELPKHPNVQMVGIVTDEERRWLYAHCTALAMPSLSEGFGLPVIEAMQWGKPVFASRCTSLPEIGGKEAYYFDDFAPDNMAGIVRQGLADFTAQAAQAATARAATFDYPRHMQQYQQLYRQMLEQQPQGGLRQQKKRFFV